MVVTGEMSLTLSAQEKLSAAMWSGQVNYVDDKQTQAYEKALGDNTQGRMCQGTSDVHWKGSLNEEGYNPVYNIGDATKPSDLRQLEPTVSRFKDIRES